MDCRPVQGMVRGGVSNTLIIRKQVKGLVSNEIIVVLLWRGSEMRHVGKSNTSCKGQIATVKRES